MSEEQKEFTLDDIKDTSKNIGINIAQFLDTIKLSAKTDQERQTMKVFLSLGEIVEKIANGELVIVNANALEPMPQVEEGDE